MVRRKLFRGATGSLVWRVTPRPGLFRPAVNAIRQKDFALQEFGFIVFVAHPGSSLRGDHVVVIFASRACGGRGSVGCERIGQGGLLSVSPKLRADERRCQV
ncbi:hypothetical protein RAD16_17520, partial [Bradyrhizobium sp. 18BD]